MTSINGNYLILPQKYYQNFQIPSAPAFRGGVESNPLPAQATQPLSYPPDTVEISATNKIKNPKEKMSNGAKVGAIALGVIGGLATFAICLKKKKINEFNKIEKLYSDKFALQQLTEHIDFKEAKTVEEGIKFAKEVLKIGEVDGNFTLDAINFANRGIVKVSNANKGKLFIPKKMHYENKGDEYFAAVVQDIKAKDFGELYINSEMFNEQTLDKHIAQNLKDLGFIKTSADNIMNGTNKVVENVSENADRLTFTAHFDDKIRTLVEKYKNNPQNLTIREKQDLLESFNNAYEIIESITSRSPLSGLHNNIKLFQKYGIEVNVDEFAKLSTKEQEAKLNQYLLEVKKKSGGLLFDAPFVSSEEHVIFHEMGHLQDFARNSKKLDNSKLKIGKHEISKSKERWGGLSYEGFKEFFEGDPKTFKKVFPDLYEFLTNQEYQQAAGKVSEYAQTSIGEFIAETYAKMVRGDKIPDDVMKLYEKYNGPKLGG